MQCRQTNGNGSPCQRRTWQWLDWVPLCHAHYQQAIGGRRELPIELVLESFADRAVRWMADPAYRHGLFDVATHANRRPRMDEVQRGWVLDLGDGYGWATVTKVEHLSPPRDGIPRVRLHFLTEQDQRPQHTVRADEPCYPYRRPQRGAA